MISWWLNVGRVNHKRKLKEKLGSLSLIFIMLGLAVLNVTASAKTPTQDCDKFGCDQAISFCDRSFQSASVVGKAHERFAFSLALRRS